jgi:hypothetical protein
MLLWSDDLDLSVGPHHRGAASATTVDTYLVLNKKADTANGLLHTHRLSFAEEVECSSLLCRM